MAVLSDFGVEPNANGIIHPQTKYKWKVSFFGLGNGSDPSNAANLNRILTYQAVKGDRPKLEFEEIELHRYNSRAWIAGKHNWSAAVWDFESDINGEVSQTFQSQLEAQETIIAIDPSRSGVQASAVSGQDYKFAMICEMLDGDTTPVESWAYEGVFIQNIDYSDVDYTANEAVKISVTFRYDHARQLVCGVGGRRFATHGTQNPSCAISG